MTTTRLSTQNLHFIDQICHSNLVILFLSQAYITMSFFQYCIITTGTCIIKIESNIKGARGRSVPADIHFKHLLICISKIKECKAVTQVITIQWNTMLILLQFLYKISQNGPL